MGFKNLGYSLTNLRDIVHYDEHTGVFTWINRAGNRAKVGDRAGSHQKSSGYRVLSIGGKLYREHRIAWQYVYGSLPTGSIDHINGVRDDNRICNLRDVNNSINMQNQHSAHSNNVSGLLGVGFYKGLYRARINIDGKQFYIGSFKTAEEASIAYLQKKIEMNAE